MPFYDYKCNNCDHTFEQRLRMDDRKIPELSPCPNCKQLGVTLQITGHFERMAPQDLGRVKPDSDWRYFLNKLKKANPDSNFKTY